LTFNNYKNIIYLAAVKNLLKGAVMKKILLLSVILLFSSISLFSKEKSLEGANLIGTYSGVYKDGEGVLNFEYKGEKITGKINYMGYSTKKINGELTYLGKKLVYSADVLINMVQGVVPVKTVLENFTAAYGDQNIKGTIIKDEWGKVKIDIAYGDKKVTGKTGWGEFDYDFGGIKIKGKRKGMLEIDYNLTFGMKKITALISVDLKIAKNTMNIRYQFLIDELSEEEQTLLYIITVFSEVFSGRAN